MLMILLLVEGRTCLAGTKLFEPVCAYPSPPLQTGLVLPVGQGVCCVVALLNPLGLAGSLPISNHPLVPVHCVKRGLTCCRVPQIRT